MMNLVIFRKFSLHVDLCLTVTSKKCTDRCHFLSPQFCYLLSLRAVQMNLTVSYLQKIGAKWPFEWKVHHLDMHRQIASFPLYCSGEAFDPLGAAFWGGGEHEWPKKL